jgi:hypothetical protein
MIEHGFTFHQIDAPPLQIISDNYKEFFDNCDEESMKCCNWSKMEQFKNYYMLDNIFVQVKSNLMRQNIIAMLHHFFTSFYCTPTHGMSQPHFGLSVRVKPTLPKVGSWSLPGLPKFRA